MATNKHQALSPIRFSAIMDTLYMRSPEEYAISKAIGIPLKTTQVDTACVTYNPEEKNISFFFNPEFVNKTSNDGLAFVFAHEARHVFLNHLVEKMEGDYPRADVLTIAQECIINDYLEDNTLLEPPGDDHLTGKSVFNTSFADFSTREGYDFIINFLKNKEDEGEEDEKGTNNSAGSNSADSSNSSDRTPQEENTSGNGDESPQSDSDTDSQDGNDTSQNNTDDQSSQSEELIKDILDNFSCPGDHMGSEEHEDGYVVSPGQHEDVSAEDISQALRDVSSDIADILDTENIEASGDMLNTLASSLSSDDNSTKNTSLPSIGKGKSKDMGTVLDESIIDDSMKIEWTNYLSDINPDILTHGSPKQDKYVWSKQNRKLIDSYPGVIIPGVMDDDEDIDDEGDGVPTVILALDFSYSIPSEFIGKLASMAESIPDEFIKVIPVTWSDTVEEFDVEEKNVVSRNGTNISAVWHYSQWVADTKLNGQQPYVLVISDGEFRFHEPWRSHFYFDSATRSSNEYSPYPPVGLDGIPDPDVLREFWNVALIDYSYNLEYFLNVNQYSLLDMSRNDLEDMALDINSLI